MFFAVMEKIQLISGVPLFQGLPKNQLQDLSTIVVEKSYRKGQTVFSEGGEGTGFHVVLEGRIKVYKLSSEGKEQILHILEKGEPFGEVPVFEGGRFPAHAQALENSKTYYFPRKDFIRLIEKNPSLALNMLAILARRLRAFTRLIDDLSLKEVPGRLASYFLRLSDQRDGARDLQLDIAKGQLASRLGTIPETLSRILAKMVRSGLIDLEGPHVRIVDREGLETMAETGKGLV